MVEFISPINPGAAPVARRDSYFRPLLDDREASALGELAQAYGQLRRATGSLADSYGALGQRFNQLSGAIMENQREQLRGEQRQKDLQIQQKRLDLQEQRNAFALQADRERLQLAVLREQDADIRDQLSAAEEFSMMNAQGNNAAFALGESVMAGLGAFPTVSNDMSQGGVTVHNTDIAPDLYSAIEQAGRTSGVNYTVTPAATPGSTQYAALGEQVGVNTPANLELNNPGFINWIADAPESVKQKAYDVFGADIVSNGTDLLNLDKVQRAVPAFKSMEDGVRYMGFWAQYRGVSEGSVDQAVRQWFGLNLTGPVEDTKFDDEESRQATLQAYRDRLSIMRDFGLDADAVLSDPAAKAAFVQGTMRAEISGYNTDKIFEALPNMPWGQLFSEGQAAFKTGKLVRNTAGSAEIFAGSREAYDLKPNQMRISLDFNSTPGASGALVVIPPSATPQQTKQAKAYVDGVQKLFQEFGYEGYTLSQGNGIQVSGGGNRGLSNTIHTEPFFAEDPMAVQIFMLPEFQKRYANLLMRTLGAIDGAVIMAPHTEGSDKQASINVNGMMVTERDFALQTLIPNLQAMRQEGLPGNKINIAADDGARPLAMDGSDPSGNVAVQALEGYGVAVNGGESGDAMTVGFTDDAVAAALQTQLGADYAEWFAEDGSASAAVDAVQAAGAQLRAELNMYRNIIESNTGGKIDEQSFRNLPHVQRAYQRFYKAFDSVQSSMLNAAFQDAKNEIKLNYEYAEETKIIPFIEDLSGSEMNQLIARHGEPVEVFKALISSESGLSIEEIETHLENGDLAKLKAWGKFTEKLGATARENSENYAINAVQVELQSADKRGETKADALLRQRPNDIKKFSLDLLADLEFYSALSETDDLNPAQFNDFTNKLNTLMELMDSKAVTDTFSRMASGNGNNTLAQDAADVLNTVTDYQEKAFMERTNAEAFTQRVTADAPLPLAYEVLQRGADGKLRTVISNDLSKEKAARNQALAQQANAAFANEDPQQLRAAFEQANTWQVDGFGASLFELIQADPEDLQRSVAGPFNMIVEAAINSGVDLASTFSGEPVAVFAAAKARAEGITPALAVQQINEVINGAFDPLTVEYIASDMPIAGVAPEIADLVRLDVLLAASNQNLAGAGAETRAKLLKLADKAIADNFSTTKIKVGYTEGVGGSGEIKARFLNRDRNAFSGTANAFKEVGEIISGPADTLEANTTRLAATIMVENLAPILEEAVAKGDMAEILGSLVIGPESAYIATDNQSFAARTVLVPGKEGTPGVVAFAHYDLEDVTSQSVRVLNQDGSSSPAFMLNTTKSFSKNYARNLQATIQLSNQRTVTVDLDPMQLQARVGARAVNSVTGEGVFNKKMTQTVPIGADRAVDGASAITYTLTEDVLRQAFDVPEGMEIENVDFSYTYALGGESVGFSVDRAIIDEALFNTRTQRVSQ